MAESKNDASVEENLTPLPAKRKPDHECIDLDDDRKSKKPEISDNNHHLDEENLELDGENPGAEAEAEAEAESEPESEEEEDEEEANGKGLVDTKGKGIMKEDKGKGKSVVHEGGEDSDSSNDGNPSDEDSDLSDDPLAEVDLDNILPSRTRRRVAQPGAYLINDLDDDDESDDSDA